MGEWAEWGGVGWGGRRASQWGVRRRGHPRKRVCGAFCGMSRTLTAPASALLGLCMTGLLLPMPVPIICGERGGEGVGEVEARGHARER